MARVLVTGATGYVGGRLVPQLLDEGHEVRCLVRNPAKLAHVTWSSKVDIVQGDVGTVSPEAFSDIDTAVYLVHGIGEGPDWVQREARDAAHFRDAAEAAGVGRLVYLGGLGIDDPSLSPHLASRHEVGRVLAAGTVPVTEFRAAVIIGSGSASFEMLRYLVEVLPVMVTPKWVRTRSQPIAISDVLRYLVSAIDAPEPVSGVFEIGGPDVVSYADMMQLYAACAGLSRRRLVPVPVLTPRLSSHWVGLVTPVPASLARPLVDSLVNEVVVRNDATLEAFGPPQRSLRDAIELALGRTRDGNVPTAFTAADRRVFARTETDPTWAGGAERQDVRQGRTHASPAAVFTAVCALGGDTGWHAGEWLWRVRGFLDVLWGGPGIRRGRRDPEQLVVGDYLDFWRVTDLRAPEFLQLHAEMLLPGDAWLEWTVTTGSGVTLLTQRARFTPRGVLGRLYWFGVAPFHQFVFPGLLKGVLRDAERRDALGARSA